MALGSFISDRNAGTSTDAPVKAAFRKAALVSRIAAIVFSRPMGPVATAPLPSQAASESATCSAPVRLTAACTPRSALHSWQSFSFHGLVPALTSNTGVVVGGVRRSGSARADSAGDKSKQKVIRLNALIAGVAFLAASQASPTADQGHSQTTAFDPKWTRAAINGRLVQPGCMVSITPAIRSATIALCPLVIAQAIRARSSAVT